MAALVHSDGGSSASRGPLVRLLGLAPAALLLCGLFTVWAAPLAAPVAAAAPTGIVVGWGYNNLGQTDAPAGLSDVTAIAAGATHGLALKSDGTVAAWGDNTYGQASVPTYDREGVAAIAAGINHNLVLKSDGRVDAWGLDTYGAIDSPGSVQSGVTAIAAGGYESLALKSDGTVVAWGYWGTVPAGLSGVTAIATGGDFNLALKSNGTVVAWGEDPHGQTDVPTGLSGVTAIAAGGGHSLALKSNGTVVAWGLNTYGQASVPTGLSGVTAIAAGGNYSLALEPSAGTALTVSGIASPYLAGDTHSVRVTANDADGNVATGYRGTVHFTSTDASAGLPAHYTFTAADAGTHTFSLTLETVGSQSVTATDTLASSITGVQSGIVVTPATVQDLVVAGIANPYVAGAAHSVAVAAKDGYGNTATGYRGKVHFTSSDPAAILPADYTFTAADAGLHTFSLGLTLNTAGTHWVRATDTVTGSITGAQSGIVVTPNPVQALAVSGIANPYVAGVAHSVTVTAMDADGHTYAGYRGTVHFTSTDPAATLPANYTFTAADAGVHTFSQTLSPALVLETEGSQSVTATDTLATSITGSQSGITVIGQTLVVSGIANPYVAGAAHSVTVAAKDAGGATYAGYRGTVHFTSTDPAAVLPANYTFTAADAGIHTFSITLNTAGDQGVRARDTVTSSITGAEYGILVTGYAVATLTFSGSSTAGVAHNFTVTAKDVDGNTDPGYLGTMHFSSTDRRAILPPDYTFTAADAGIHVFSVTLKTAGPQGVRARDTVTSTLTGAQYEIVVAPAAATTLTVSGLGSPRTHGTGGTITVTARDAYGNVATGYRGTVTFTSTDYHAVLPANYTFTAAGAGTHTFNIDLITVGTQAVRARDTVTVTITGLERGIVVS
jgi:hypothetical protein